MNTGGALGHLPVILVGAWEDDRECGQYEIRQCENEKRDPEMPFLFWVLFGEVFIFPKDLLVTVFDDKDVMKKSRGEEIDGAGKDHGLHRRCEPGVFDKFQVNGFH